MGRIFGIVDGASDLEDAFQTDVFEFRSAAKQHAKSFTARKPFSQVLPPVGTQAIPARPRRNMPAISNSTAVPRENVSSATGGLQKCSTAPDAGAEVKWPSLGTLSSLAAIPKDVVKVTVGVQTLSTPANWPNAGDTKPGEPMLDMSYVSEHGEDAPDCKKTVGIHSEQPACAASPPRVDNPSDDAGNRIMSAPVPEENRPLKAPRYRFNGTVRKQSRPGTGKDRSRLGGGNPARKEIEIPSMGIARRREGVESNRNEPTLVASIADASARPLATAREIEPHQIVSGSGDRWQSELRQTFQKLRDSAA